MFRISVDIDNYIQKKEIVNVDEVISNEYTVYRVDENAYNSLYVGWRLKNLTSPCDLSLDEAYVKDRIRELTDNLRNTDYVVIEILEHKILGKKENEHLSQTETTIVCEDRNKIYEKRQMWRTEITKLRVLQNKN